MPDHVTKEYETQANLIKSLFEASQAMSENVDTHINRFQVSLMSTLSCHHLLTAHAGREDASHNVEGRDHGRLRHPEYRTQKIVSRAARRALIGQDRPQAPIGPA